MNEIIVSSIVISALHALIPNHSLPIVAVGKRFSWTGRKTVFVTFLAALAHVFSTLVIGFLLSFIGIKLNYEIGHLLKWVTPAILIGMGLFFIWQHHTHNHFHLGPQESEAGNSRKMMVWILTAMFFSPCLEIEAIFFASSHYGWRFVFLIAAIYSILTILGMITWVALVFKGSQKFDSHKIEHNIGIITGVTLLLTGLVFIFIH